MDRYKYRYIAIDIDITSPQIYHDKYKCHGMFPSNVFSVHSDTFNFGFHNMIILICNLYSDAFK